MKKAEVMGYLLEMAQSGGAILLGGEVKDLDNAVRRLKITDRPIKTKDDLKYLAWQEHPDIYNKGLTRYLEEKDIKHSSKAHEFLKRVAKNPNVLPSRLKFTGKRKIINSFGGAEKTKEYALILYPDHILERAGKNEIENERYRRMIRRVSPRNWDCVDNKNIGDTLF